MQKVAELYYLKEVSSTECNIFSSVQSLSRVGLWDPMNCSMPGLPLQTQHVKWTLSNHIEIKVAHCLQTVQLISHVQLFITPWTTVYQAFLSIANSQSLFKLMSIESVMPSNHLILCHPLLLPPSIFPSIRVFSNESVLHIRWPKYWSFSFSIIPMNIQDWFPLGWTGWISLQSKGVSRVFSNTTVQKHQFFVSQLSL